MESKFKISTSVLAARLHQLAATFAQGQEWDAEENQEDEEDNGDQNSGFVLEKP